MAYNPALLVGTYDPQHVAVLGTGQTGFVANADGSYTISNLQNVVNNLPGYGAYSDNNQNPPNNPLEGDLVDFRAVTYNTSTGTFNYFFDRENFAMNGTDAQGPLGATIVGYEQVGTTQNFLLENIDAYVAGPNGTYTGRPGVNFFLLSHTDTLNNLDPNTFDPVTNAFFANGPVTFEPPAFNFASAVPAPSMGLVLGLVFAGTVIARSLRRAA